MKTLLIYLLLSVSTGGYNSGTVTVIERYSTKVDCDNTVMHIKDTGLDGNARFKCVPSQSLVKE